MNTTSCHIKSILRRYGCDTNEGQVVIILVFHKHGSGPIAHIDEPSEFVFIIDIERIDSVFVRCFAKIKRNILLVTLFIMCVILVDYVIDFHEVNLLLSSIEEVTMRVTDHLVID